MAVRENGGKGKKEGGREMGDATWEDGKRGKEEKGRDGKEERSDNGRMEREGEGKRRKAGRGEK